MLVRNVDYLGTHFKIGGNPTGTEIYRIQHTIETLKASENALFLKLQKDRADSNYLLENDCRQHILEILWGWQDLKRLVESLPDSFVDKYFWQEKIVEGLKRGGNLYMIFLQRYPLPRLA